MNLCSHSLFSKNSRKGRLPLPALLTLSALILGLGVAASSARGTTAKAARKTARAVESLGAPVKAYGSKDAPITMEVFSDYECPSCRNLYENTLRPMIGDYVASGKVYLIHRDFPLPMHKYGFEAARWANAAARVGEFPAVEAALYDNQDSWGADGNIEKYVSAAMSTAEFKRVQKQMEGCTAPPGAAAQGHGCPLDGYIESDREMGMRIPVQATPTYVITYKGQHLPAATGFVSWPILKQFFDSLLSQ
ncbi:MAG TPA: thioredoxin domain-containing protein [Candidatus Acidoferrales bacterium]|nr:thioredoxin domain-containing protein [Candidatus Acidoferrales bacterium]